ncbi:YjbF family lipoprotein [Paracoccaceae bacterium]|nr:YjbF family lipoprotein [Paracoccaceae bacterium]
MIKKIMLSVFLLGLSCSSDEIISTEKASFYKIYKDIVIKKSTTSQAEQIKKEKAYDKVWLSKFNQPIILLSSLDGKNTATLVALGNYKNKLTWVSADGISVTFLNGILIATRGYSQDLMESQNNGLDTLFSKNTKKRLKKYRYLNSENQYRELSFICSVVAKKNTPSFFLDMKIETTKFTETCKAGTTSHTNEYYVLPNTSIVLKSKQWISEANGSMVIYNYYAFQNNLF